MANFSNSRFIKFIPSEESFYLRQNHPNAFLLLSLIAERARRISGLPDGLQIGEAFIGDYKEAGIETEMKYRTAKKILEMRGHIKICETCRNRKKSTTGITTVGTKVKLLKSGIWDINQEVHDDRLNDRITTEQRPNNDEEERIRMNNKEQEQQQQSDVVGPVILDFENEKRLLEEPQDLKDQTKIDFIAGIQNLKPEENRFLFKFPLERIKLAVEYSKTIVIHTTLIQTLIWHCKQAIPPISAEQIEIRNKEFAKINSQTSFDFFTQCKSMLNGKFYDFIKENNSLKIGDKERNEEISVHEKPEIYKQLVETALRKYGLWIPLQEQLQNTTEAIN